MRYSRLIPRVAVVLLVALTLGCASEKKFVPDKGMTDEQIIDAYYASQPVKEHYRLLIKTYLDCAKKLHDAKKEDIKYAEEDLIPHLEEYEPDGVIDLTICIHILEEIRKDFIVKDYCTQMVEYAKVLQLLLQCYFDQYYEGEGTYRDDTQDNIIEVLEDFIKAREQNKNDFQWSQIASEITEMVTSVISSEVAGNSMKEKMSKVSKWWLEHQ
jgi:hypothetical protein